MIFFSSTKTTRDLENLFYTHNFNPMKTLLTFIYLFFLTFLSFSQSPDGFSYQSIVRDALGNLKKNQSVSIIFEIIDASNAVKYTESHTTTTNDYGLVNLVIGQGATSDDFSAIDWSSETYSIKMKIDGTDMGTSQLWSVPYATYAKSSGSSIAGPEGPQGYA